MLRLLGFLFLLAVSFQARAVVPPEGGWYWSSVEPGRGFNIEIQDQNLFVAMFVYQSNGAPIWLQAGGAMSSGTVFVSTLYAYSGGQCLGCTYQAPTSQPVGTIQITFTSPTTATVSTTGTGINSTMYVKRFDFVGYMGTVPDALQGEWSFVDGSPSYPVYFGDRLTFTGISYPNGIRSATGYRTGSYANAALGWVQNNQLYILLDSSTSYWQLWIISAASFNRAEGMSYTYLKGSNPGSGMPSIAYRNKSLSGATNAFPYSQDGTAKVASTAQTSAPTSQDSERAKAAAASGIQSTFTSEQIGIIRNLEAQVLSRSKNSLLSN